MSNAMKYGIAPQVIVVNTGNADSCVWDINLNLEEVDIRKEKKT